MNIFNLDTGQLPKSAHNLFGWFLFGVADGTQLHFDGHEPLTRELAKSVIIHGLRNEYYRSGDIEKGVYGVGFGGYLRSLLIDSRYSIKFPSLPVAFVLGSFEYQIKTVPGDRVGFRIDNHMFYGSRPHEGLSDGDSSAANERLWKAIQDRPKIISFLDSMFREDTILTHGGGTLDQTFTWTERGDAKLGGITGRKFVLTRDVGGRLDIQPWPEYEEFTHPIL